MKPRFASLLAILVASAPLLSAGEVERLRALVSEQELQIQQLELKVAQLSNSTPPASTTSTQAAIQTTTAETCPEPATNLSSTYTVKAGDNMVSIARQHGTTSSTINKLNGLKSDDIIRPGQKLKIPSSPTTASTESVQPPPPTPEPSITPAAIPSSNTVKHMVAYKETFFSIAKKHDVSVDALIKENPSINPKTLRVGHIIQIPGKLEASSSVPSPAPEQNSALSSHANIPVSGQSSSASQPRASDKPVKITKEISYSDFAKNYNTTPSRLDEINGLRLDPTTILAKGSELYIPQQP